MHVAWQDSRDNQAMKDSAQYWLNTGAGNDGLHSKVNGLFWWAWNANSGVPWPCAVQQG